LIGRDLRLAPVDCELHQRVGMRRRSETVLVLGTGQRSGQATARSLARAGFRVVGAWGGGRLSGRTRYCERLFEIPSSRDAEAFVAAVRELCERERIRAIVPLADELLGMLLTRPEAAAGATVVGPTLAEFRRLCDKLGLLEAAASAGVLGPPSATVAPGGALPELPLPAYVKVVSSMYEGRPAGRPVRAEDRHALKRLVEQLTAAGDTVLVQTEVTGRKWHYYFARGAGWTRELAGVVLHDHPYRVGQSTVLDFRPMPPALSAGSRALLEPGGFLGGGSIQWIERDGEWFVHDIGLRMPASVAGQIAAGLDLPRLAVAAALGDEPPPARVSARRSRYVWLVGEGLLFRDALAGLPGDRTPLQVVGTMALAALSPRRRLVPFDPTDPLPTLAALSTIVRRPRALSAAPPALEATPRAGARPA
jgi:predicted ATP-grasp superfamily ATP-dependent carboligase